MLIDWSLRSGGIALLLSSVAARGAAPADPVADADANANADADTGWPDYGHDPGGTRYSPARQIDRSNVGRLQLAWTYRTGANHETTELVRKAAFESTPILADDKLFLTTPYSH